MWPHYGIRLTLWLLCIVAEIPLCWLLWSRRSLTLPWFTLWVTGKLLTNIVEVFFRHHSVYDMIWRYDSVTLLILMAFAVAEQARTLGGNVKRSLITAGFVGCIVHMFLVVELRMAASMLDLVFSGLALGQLVMGLFLVQLWSCRPRPMALVTAIYLLASAACYYSASTFPFTIGRAVMAIELLSACGWIWALRRPTLD